MDDQIITGLDIGSAKVCAVIMQKNENGFPMVLGVGRASSYGLKKGLIVNIESMIQSINQALEEAELMAGVNVDRIYCGISGSHIESQNSRGVVAVSNKSREISYSELERVIEAAQSVNFSQDREIIHVIPLEFIIDDQDSIRDPIGMKGLRLEVKAHIVTAHMSTVQNLRRTISRAGFTVEDFVLSSLASSEAILSSEEREGGTLIIDIGSGTTDVLLYLGDSVHYSSVFPIASRHVTHDIAVGLKITENVAEKLKIEYGCCLSNMASEDDCLVIPSSLGRESRRISHVSLCDIIGPRIEEIIHLIYQDLKAQDILSLITGGVILTGGGSLIKGLEELSEQIFNLPTRIAYPKEFEGLKDKVSTPVFSTAVGLAIYGLREGKQDIYINNQVQKGGIFKRMKNSLSDFAKELFA